ncbi:MAG: hypothetical protein ABUS47_16215 [Steroidobacter sp.]
MTKVTKHKHLTKEAQAFYEQTITDYGIDDGVGRMHVLMAAESLDRIREAQAALKQNRGLTVRDKTGALRPHPAIAVERAARQAYATAFRLLKLEPSQVK